MLIRVLRPGITMNLYKAYRNKANKILVDVTVHGKSGVYQSKRWKNVSAAKELVRQAFKVDSLEDLDIIDRYSGESKIMDEVFKDYMKSKARQKNIKINKYIANRYSITPSIDKRRKRIYDDIFLKDRKGKYKGYKMDLESVQRDVDDNKIDIEVLSERLEQLNNAFKDGIDTPMGKVYNSEERYIHIISEHKDEIYTDHGTTSIIKVLSDPDRIYEYISPGKKRIKGMSYIGYSDDKEELLVATRDGKIITAYKPDDNYLVNSVYTKELLYERDNGNNRY